jgi:uncharacterized protein (DUF736 family)
MNRVNRSRRGNGRNFVRATNPVTVKQSHGFLKQTRQMVMNDGVRRLSTNKQLVSIPNHNYQSKHQQTFRVLAATTGSGAGTSISVTSASIVAAVLAELGYPADTTTNTQISVHEIRVYQSAPHMTPANSSGYAANALAVRVQNIQTGSGVIGLFEDVASPSGIAHVRYAYSLSNRPSFNQSSTSATLAYITSVTGTLLVVDVLATVLVTPGTLPAAMYDIPTDPDADDIDLSIFKNAIKIHANTL